MIFISRYSERFFTHNSSVLWFNYRSSCASFTFEEKINFKISRQLQIEKQHAALYRIISEHACLTPLVSTTNYYCTLYKSTIVTILE